MPAGDEELLAEYLSLINQQTVLVERVVEAFRDRDVVEIGTLSESIDEVNAENDGIARGYGFKVCGQGEGEPAAPGNAATDAAPGELVEVGTAVSEGPFPIATVQSRVVS